jgi:catechol 2,3-dioxygenase-like lactoylglutathione lyase family enzyme
MLLPDGSQILSAVGDRANDLEEVRLRDAVGEPQPVSRRWARRLRGQHLDHRDAPPAEHGGLVSPDQTTAEDDGDVGVGDAVLERPPAGVDVEAGVFEKGRQLRLAGGEQEDALAAVLGHTGILPALPAFQRDAVGTFGGMRPETLDHVALWVGDRDALADFLVDRLGMHVIERTDAFTLVGADARRGKLTLVAVDGDREAGVLARIGLRVFDLAEALAELPPDVAVERPAPGRATFTAPEGLPIALVEVEGGVAYDLDHVAFSVPDPDATRESLVELGFEPDDGRLTVGEAYVELEGGKASATERPLLNHLGLKVDSAEEHIAEAKRRGLEIDNVVDAANTYAVFVWGPDGIKLEYVEHKPSFSLV